MSRWSWRHEDDDEDDDQPPQDWGRFEAELAPQAWNDVYAMPESETKAAILRVLQGDDPNDVIKEMGVTIEELADPDEGWSVLRIDGISIFYKRLTPADCRELGHFADVLVARIDKLVD